MGVQVGLMEVGHYPPDNTERSGTDFSHYFFYVRTRYIFACLPVRLRRGCSLFSTHPLRAETLHDNRFSRPGGRFPPLFFVVFLRGFTMGGESPGNLVKFSRTTTNNTIACGDWKPCRGPWRAAPRVGTARRQNLAKEA